MSPTVSTNDGSFLPWIFYAQKGLGFRIQFLCATPYIQFSNVFYKDYEEGLLRDLLFLDALCAWFVRVFCADKHIGVMNACFLRTAFLHPHNKHGKMLSAEMSL